MATTKQIKFPTRSDYEGAWDSEQTAMHGFGVYTFPDYSVYHGYFTNGKFHGFGSIKLAAPYNFIIRGYFEDGKLTKIERMIFQDGLNAKAKPKGNGLDFSEWTYCSDEDRRYPAEIINGLSAVGAYATITSSASADRPLRANEFDTEEGIYNVESGYITDRLPPFSPATFIPCPNEINWIINNCRKGYGRKEKHNEPTKKITRTIITTNIESQIQKTKKFEEKCHWEQNPAQKYFEKLYALEMAEAREAMGMDMAGSGYKKSKPKMADNVAMFASENKSCSSFSIGKIKDSTLERMVCLDKMHLEFSEKSFSPNKSLLDVEIHLFD